MPVHFPPFPIAGATSPTNAATAISNATATLLPTWRIVLAGVRQNLLDAKVLVVGDSNTFGAGGNGTFATGDVKSYSWPTRLAQLINDSGTPASWQSFFGNSSPEASLTNSSNDSRISLSGAGALANSPFEDSTIGGRFMALATNTAGTISFTPSDVVDTFLVYYAKFPGGGTFNVDINGGTATPINYNAALALVSQTFTANLGINTINFSHTGSDILAYPCMGVVATNSKRRAVNIMNAGWGGATTVDRGTGATNYSWTHSYGNPYNPIPFITSLAPHLTIISLGINDWISAQTVSAFSAALQTVITAAKAGGGDVILCAPANTDPVSIGTPVATQLQFVAAIQALAISNSCAFVDLWSRTYPYDSYYRGGLGMYYNGAHPNGYGYYDHAQAIANIMLG